MRREFGFLNEVETYQVDAFRFEPLPSIRAAVETVHSTGRTSGPWYYPPLQPVSFHPARQGAAPLVNAPSFQLPSTHRLDDGTETGGDQYLAEFLTTALGFALGLRLNPSPWTHFYRVAIQPGTLVDFTPGRGGVDRFLATCFEFWRRHEAQRHTIFGALHWFLFCQSYQHAFEVFAGQYTVLDTCWNIHATQTGEHAPTHAARPRILAEAYELSLPQWAHGDTTSALATLRNALFHEGRYGSEPTGFAHPAPPFDQIDDELIGFNARLIAAMLGVRSRYTRSAVPYNQRQLLWD